MRKTAASVPKPIGTPFVALAKVALILDLAKALELLWQDNNWIKFLST
jgi:hypothetical protein